MVPCGCEEIFEEELYVEGESAWGISPVELLVCSWLQTG